MVQIQTGCEADGCAMRDERQKPLSDKGRENWDKIFKKNKDKDKEKEDKDGRSM